MENSVLKLLNARWAGRAISSEPLPEKIILELIEAARLTPSCSNKQPWRFLFLESEEAKAKGIEVFYPGNRVWASRAPLIVIGYSKAADDCLMDNDRKYHQFDLGMAAMNLMLSATFHNLVARPMAGFDPVKIKEQFSLEPEDEPLVMIAIGRLSEDESHLPDHLKGKNTMPRERMEASKICKRL